MGIFGINMPTLYGEGCNAFYRLQEEIMKTSTDTSLFSWGNYPLYHGEKILPAMKRVMGSIESEMDPLSQTYLFAPSPACFNFLGDSIVNEGPMTAVEVCL